MKIKLLFLSALLITALASFTLSSKSGATGTGTVQIELPAGVKASLENASVGVAKTQQELQFANYIETFYTDASGIAQLSDLEAGTYYIDGYVLGDSDKEYFATAKIEVVAGKSTAFKLKLVERK